MTPNKTHTIGRISVPDQYFRDFLRGHLDGDGTVLTYIDTYSSYKNRRYTYTRLYVKFISASKPHIFWLSETISTLINVKGSLTKYVNKYQTTMWTLKFAKKESIILLKWIYYDPLLPALRRKQLLVNELLKDLDNFNCTEPWKR